eukprot:3897546-Prymnesium_polylepis.1
MYPTKVAAEVNGRRERRGGRAGGTCQGWSRACRPRGRVLRRRQADRSSQPTEPIDRHTVSARCTCPPPPSVPCTTF